MAGIPRRTALTLALAALSSTACERSPASRGAPARDDPARKLEPAAPEAPPAPGFECSVLVRGPSGLPLSSLRVDMLPEGGGEPLSEGLTDELGIARFRVPAANYNVRIANREREVLAQVGYEVSGDAPTPIEVIIGRGRGGGK